MSPSRLDPLDSRRGHTVGDERKRAFRFVRDKDGLAERGHAGGDASHVPRHDGRHRLTGTHVVAGTRRNHETDARVDSVVHLRAPTA